MLFEYLSYFTSLSRDLAQPVEKTTALYIRVTYAHNFFNLNVDK